MTIALSLCRIKCWSSNKRVCVYKTITSEMSQSHPTCAACDKPRTQFKSSGRYRLCAESTCVQGRLRERSSRRYHGALQDERKRVARQRARRLASNPKSRALGVLEAALNNHTKEMKLGVHPYAVEGDVMKVMVLKNSSGFHVRRATKREQRDL